MSKTKISNEQKSELIEKYNNSNISCRKLGKLYGISNWRIRKILRDNGIKIKKCDIRDHKYEFDEHYFSKIDTEAKAYFLGLMYSDGCNHITSASIQLQEKDKAILESFIKELNGNNVLYFYNLNAKNPKHQNAFKLSLNSKIMADDLSKLGCYPKKSLILDFPTEEQVPNHLLKHFIRGYLDGDGCICETYCNRKGAKYRAVHVRLFSANKFIIGVQKAIQKNLCIKSYIIDSHANGITKTFMVPCYKNSIIFLNWLYDNATIYLDRKYQRYLHIKNFKSLIHLRERDSKGHYIKKSAPK